MIDLITIAAIIGGVKYGEYRTEKRLKAEAMKVLGGDGRDGKYYGNTQAQNEPAEDRRYAGAPPHFSPELRDLLVTGPHGSEQFRPEILGKLAHRFSQCALESVDLHGLDLEANKLLAYRLIAPKAADEPSALDAIATIIDRGGAASCTLSCILDRGERIVVFAAGPMPATISRNVHFLPIPMKMKPSQASDKAAVDKADKPKVVNGAGSSTNHAEDPVTEIMPSKET